VRTGDAELARELAPQLLDIVAAHVRGTRYGIGVDAADGLLVQGEDGLALTWMDARVDGRPITQRAGKAVEINALWINGLAVVASLLESVGRDSAEVRAHEARARASFAGAFVAGGRCFDVVGDTSLRPNQLLAVSLPHAPLTDRGRRVVRAAAHVHRTAQPQPRRRRLRRPPPRRTRLTRCRLPSGHGLAVADRPVRRGGP